MAADKGKLTDQQHRALTARGTSIALSAGAGCGKTFVLTERFLAQLEPKEGRPRLSEIVAITFTERAAREMRDRIRTACRQRLLDADPKHTDYWLQLIRELDSARISTIHSFCGSLLRAHAVEARLDPQFRVLDQAQSETILHELIHDQLRDMLSEQDETIVQLIVKYGLSSLEDMIVTLLGRRQVIEWQQWIDETPESLAKRWEQVWRAAIVPEIAHTITRSQPATTIVEIANTCRPDNATMQGRCDLLLEQLQGATGTRALRLIRDNAQVRGGGGKKAWPDEQIYDRFRDACTALRKLVDSFKVLEPMEADVCIPAAEDSLHVLAMAKKIVDAYDDKKRELACLDFDDLLIKATRLLTKPNGEALRRRISSQLSLLLVDEFQDTNPIQAELVKALCGDGLTSGKLFFVGDYKQAIYRFRDADPDVFRELRAAMPDGGRLPLSLNFRSQPSVLDFINSLFFDAMGDDYERLDAHRPQVSQTPTVEFLWAPDTNPTDRTGQAERQHRIEADWIARRVKAMLKSGEEIVWDDGADMKTRPVRPGDIAILFRALSNVSHYEDALRRYGIDYYLVGGHAFYAQQEVYDLLNLLRAIANKNDELSLVGVLRSPFFNLDDETLYWLAQHPLGICHGLLAEAWPELSIEQRRRVELAARVFVELRELKDRVPIAQLIGRALEQTGFDAIVLSEFLGQRKLANLRKLIDQARDFDRSGILTLSDFITQLSEFVARQPKESLAATHPETAGVVRLMTIHQAKGLEFPVVIVSDMNRPMKGPSMSVGFTPEMGPMVKAKDGLSGLDMYKQSEKLKDENELVRLLYVATTRAADYLILSSCIADLDKPAGLWMKLLGKRFDLATGGYKRELPGDWPLPKVKVIAEQPKVSSRGSRVTVRRDLSKLADKASELADRGSGQLPKFVLPVERTPSVRRQFSISRVSGELYTESHIGAFDIEDSDSVRQPTDIDPRSLGTLVHEVLAEIEFGQAADVRSLVQRHAKRHIPDSLDNLDEPIAMVNRFIGSPRANELAQATQVHAELEFLLAWPPDDTRPTDRYMQGVIDCLYQDRSGEWHLIDYKTNRTSAATLDSVASSYEMQMYAYALAVERVIGNPPVELVLHFLRSGNEHLFTWDAKSRRRAIESISRAITI